MNLVMASVLLLAMLAFQPTLIYGSKGLGAASVFSSKNGNGKGKRHSAVLGASSSSSSSLSSAKLVLALEPADIKVRAARGASDTAAAPASGSISGKRAKNNNNKKLNKNLTPENAPQANGNAGRKHLDKKFSAAAANQQQQHGNNNNNNSNNKGKQRQLLKSQQHQSHGKRAGLKSKSNSEKSSTDGEKSQSTCRYSKSTWSECDAKTNMRTRTLTLKKGEDNCLPTRTIEKKCKKSCRYEKGSWTECINGQMTRQDKLKSTGGGTVVDSSCDAVRSINKKCPAGGAGKHAGGKANKERKNKDKASRRVPQPHAAA